MNSGSRERVERRLAAIVAADVAGYSRLMGEDEEGTHAALTAVRREVSPPGSPSIAAALSKPPATGYWPNSPASSMRCAAPSNCSAR
jgi:adenylate cyclase